MADSDGDAHADSHGLKAVSEAQRSGCESHVTDDEIP
jgi:hypothetical protein